VTPRLVAAAGAALAAAVLFAQPAAAQTQTSPACGVTGDATAPASITYDPFATAGLSQATIPLVLRRNRSGNTAADGLQVGRTADVSLVLTTPASSPAIEITYEGERVLYREGSTAGRPKGQSSDGGASGGGEIRYRFGGLQDSDLSPPIPLVVTIPSGADFAASEVIEFDILYICSGAGGMQSVPFPVRANRAIRLNINVVSALQAYYAGSALDFGEIGEVTTEAVLSSPGRYTTSASNALRVRSSGPFEVRVRSQNDFRLTFPGGRLSDPQQTLRYAVNFLGQEITSNTSFASRTCSRAGIGSAGVLPIQATLREGGVGKAASSAYGDTVSITFTPVVTASAAQPCAG
jgi:hypothetical protein